MVMQPVSVCACMRYPAVLQADQYRQSATERQQRQIAKFKFYFSRFDNHLLSIKLESHLLHESRARASSLMQMGRTLERKGGREGG